MSYRGRETVLGLMLAFGIVASSLTLLAIEISELVQAQEFARNELDLKRVDRWLPTADAVQQGPFWLAYDGRTRTARYVVEGVSAATLKDGDVRRYSHFYSDIAAPPEARASDSDYTGSGYDRGHLAPSANHLLTASDNAATFVLSNVAPQEATMNRGIWRRIENHVRELASMHSAVVLTCPLYLPTGNRLCVEVIGSGQVWVPTHFGKAILYRLRSGEYAMQAWIVPNAAVGNQSIDAFAVSIDRFESAAGLDCWAALPDLLEMTLESADPLRPVPEERLPR